MLLFLNAGLAPELCEFDISECEPLYRQISSLQQWDSREAVVKTEEITGGGLTQCYLEIQDLEHHRAMAL